MVLDSSAIVAIELQEPGFERLIDKIGDAKAVVIGIPTMFETVIVLSRRRGQDARPWLRGFLRSAKAEAVTFTDEHLDAAIDAFLRFGKGRHRAALNFGDCMAYAVAAVAGMPLLYTGNDFAQTDIPAA
jgi:ribonuclease VapC